MAKNRVFFPQEALDEWIHHERVDFRGSDLVIRGEGRRYRVLEAVRVLAEVSGAGDAHELTGKVKSVAFLTELGAELLGSSMIIGDLAYEVVPGFAGAPVGAFSEHLGDPARSRNLAQSSGLVVREKPRSDEDLLAQYLLQNLE